MNNSHFCTACQWKLQSSNDLKPANPITLHPCKVNAGATSFPQTLNVNGKLCTGRTTFRVCLHQATDRPPDSKMQFNEWLLQSPQQRSRQGTGCFFFEVLDLLYYIYFCPTKKLLAWPHFKQSHSSCPRITALHWQCWKICCLGQKLWRSILNSVHSIL